MKGNTMTKMTKECECGKEFSYPVRQAMRKMARIVLKKGGKPSIKKTLKYVFPHERGMCWECIRAARAAAGKELIRRSDRRDALGQAF